MIIIKRAIGGFALSLVFLLFFMYMISGVRLVFQSHAKIEAEKLFLGSLSSSFQPFEPEDDFKSTTLPSHVLAQAPEVAAESAISVSSNLTNLREIFFEKSPGKVLPIASLTKLMTAVVVLDNYNLSEPVTVSKTADLQEPMRQDVTLGSTMPASDFLEIMLVSSSNKSAYALAEKLGTEEFVKLMNEKAKDMGLKNTHFADPTGLSSENVSTAKDLVKLAENILQKYPRIAEVSRAKQVYLSNFGIIKNTDQLLEEIPSIIFSKTGFTTQANGCLFLVTRENEDENYLIHVVLGADDRFSEMRKVVNWSNSVNK